MIAALCTAGGFIAGLLIASLVAARHLADLEAELHHLYRGRNE